MQKYTEIYLRIKRLFVYLPCSKQASPWILFVSQSITSARTASFLREVRLSVCVNLFNLTQNRWNPKTNKYQTNDNRNEENNYYFDVMYADMDTCTKLVEW